MNDTIAAISTAQGVGAISIIRVSGPDAFSIVNKVFTGKDLTNVPSHTIHYGKIIDQNSPIDEVLVTVMKAPKTFEEGMTRLEDILAKMQSDDTSLAESVKLYAEAASLVEYCSRTLGKVSLQIDEIDSRLAAASEAPDGPEVKNDVEEQR